MSEQKIEFKIRSPHRLLVLPAIIFIMTLAITFCFWKYTSNTARYQDEIQFERSWKDLLFAIQQQLDLHVSDLSNARGLFAASKVVDRDEWRAYLEGQNYRKIYPGLVSMEYVEHVPSDKKSEFLNRVRNDKSVSVEGYSDFDIFPAGDRAFYDVVTYIEPFEINSMVFGKDIQTDDELRAALHKARDQGVPVATKQLRLSYGAAVDQSPGFMIVLAIYKNGTSHETIEDKRANLAGYVVRVIEFRGLFEEIILRLPRKLDVAFEMFSGPLMKKEMLSYEYDENPEGTDHRFESVHEIMVAGKMWTFRFHTGPDYGKKDFDDHLPSFLLASGILLSLMLSGLFYFLAVSRHRAIETGEEWLRARDAALKATRAKSDFLATMSHEIRTPMNSILGMAEVLSMTYLDKEQKEFLAVLRRSGSNLMNLINNILDLSKVEAGHLEFEEADFDLEEMIQKTIEMLGISARQKGLSLSYVVSTDIPRFVNSDPARLRQVLANLISNGIKFTHKGGVELRVTKELSRHSSRDYDLVFSVKDTGIGIAREKLAIIFEPFTQVDASITREYGGTGLGLSISKRIVELLGGRIWAESKPGSGSTFTFKIPLRQAGQKQVPVYTEGDLGKMRMLIADKDPIVRQQLKDWFTKQGMIVAETSGAKECLSEIESGYQSGKPYQILLIDREIPHTGGVELVKNLTHDSRFEGKILLLIDKETSRHDIDFFNRIGVAHSLPKPLDETQAVECVKRVASRKLNELSGQSTSSLKLRREIKILLVEDNRDNRFLVQTYLKNVNCQIESAENGEEGVEKAKSGQYDIILMDIQMPVMDGFTATKLIREWEIKEQKSATPIIALTAHAYKEDVVRSLQVGCNSHLSKPIQREVLLETIHQFTR